MAKGKKTGGRVKGTPNKTTAQLKDAILEAAETANPAGLVGYLRDLALNNSTAFAGLLGKILPKDVNLGLDNETVLAITRSFVQAKSDG